MNPGRSGAIRWCTPSLHTWVSRLSRRRCRPLVARPPTGASSCKSTTTGHSSKLRPTSCRSCPRSTSTASGPSRPRGINEATTRPDSQRLRAGKKSPLQGVSQAFLERLFGARKTGPSAHEPPMSSGIVAGGGHEQRPIEGWSVNIDWSSTVLPQHRPLPKADTAPQPSHLRTLWPPRGFPRWLHQSSTESPGLTGSTHRR